MTGGASGLGRGTVERFVKQGGKVVIGDLPTSKGNDLAQELGDSAVFVPMNVRIYSKIVICTNSIIQIYIARAGLIKPT